METELGEFNLHGQKGINPDQLGLGTGGGRKSVLFGKSFLFFCVFF